MMTIPKRMIFILFMVASITTLAQASLTELHGATILNHKSIFAHTGQDPVYKSIDGGVFPIIPRLNKKISWQINLNDVTTSFTNTIINNNDWSPNEVTQLPTVSTTQSDIHKLIQQQIDQIDSTNLITITGSNVPAPPAMLLLVSGIFACSRRKA
ncbi:MAG: hypothetical protein HOI88_05465 [Phycisphaerae bacterium]|jgi:hypothetical protein|nr:hypothetical protein [Phycisphaerae bacterium]